MHSKFLLGFCVLALAFSTGWAIKCYHCNSNDNMGCRDPFDASDAREFIIDCSELNGTANGKKIEYTFCRKTTQKTALPGMKDEDKRVIRTCGHLSDGRLDHEEGEDKNALKCYRRVGTFEVEMWYCACFADECNPAGKPLPTFATIATLIFLAVGAFFK